MHPQQKSKQCFYGNRATALNRLQEARDSIAPNMDALRFEAQLRPSAKKCFVNCLERLLVLENKTYLDT
ncbi:hypothetical protein HMPREF9069_00970 [Atopobium sp. oral taxon 810 str. F0209]|nr:hypothetical protein HMPREF9069_00970 [Atopobium sp. oral taxon 810 str. F0209]